MKTCRSHARLTNRARVSFPIFPLTHSARINVLQLTFFNDCKFLAFALESLMKLCLNLIFQFKGLSLVQWSENRKFEKKNIFLNKLKKKLFEKMMIFI